MLEGIGVQVYGDRCMRPQRPRAMGPSRLDSDYESGSDGGSGRGVAASRLMEGDGDDERFQLLAMRVPVEALPMVLIYQWRTEDLQLVVGGAALAAPYRKGGPLLLWCCRGVCTRRECSCLGDGWRRTRCARIVRTRTMKKTMKETRLLLEWVHQISSLVSGQASRGGQAGGEEKHGRL